MQIKSLISINPAFYVSKALNTCKLRSYGIWLFPITSENYIQLYWVEPWLVGRWLATIENWFIISSILKDWRLVYCANWLMNCDLFCGPMNITPSHVVISIDWKVEFWTKNDLLSIMVFKTCLIEDDLISKTIKCMVGTFF